MEAPQEVRDRERSPRREVTNRTSTAIMTYRLENHLRELRATAVETLQADDPMHEQIGKLVTEARALIRRASEDEELMHQPMRGSIIYLRNMAGQNHPVRCDLDDTLSTVVCRAVTWLIGMQRVECCKPDSVEILDKDETLRELGVRDGDVILWVLRSLPSAVV